MLEQLKEIIKQAGEIFKEGYYSKKDITHKGTKDLVTQYDIAVEKFLKEKFSVAFPDYNIIAEESDNTKIEFNNSIIIDPIDGTTNFVNKVPHCAISVGVFKEKKPYIGIVYNPILNELFSAEVEKGAYCNGEKIEVSLEDDFQLSLIGTGFPYTSSHNKDDLDFVMDNLQRILPKCQDIRRFGSASVDLCMVANGVYEGYYEINLHAWDVAAGMIILHEAGGKVTNHFGKEFDMFNDRCIVATNSKIHETLVSLIE
jgi:myo-inositol-1(or 4)-monophosphatase